MADDYNLNANAVDVAVTGGVFFGTSTQVAAITATGPLTGLKFAGYLSEDGIEEERELGESEGKVAWQNNAEVRTVVTSAGSTTIHFTAIENSKDVRQLFYGATEAADGTMTFNPGKSWAGGIVWEYVDLNKSTGEVTKWRKWAENARVSEVGTMTMSNGELLGFEITITISGDVKSSYTKTTAEDEPSGE